MLYVVLQMASVEKKSVKFFLVHALKAYRASVDIAALMPNLGARLKLVFNLRLWPLYPWVRLR